MPRGRAGCPRGEAGLHANSHSDGPRHRRSEELLRAAAAVLPKTGEDFLPAVVEEIAGALKAELVLVGEFAGTDRVRTVALWRGGQIVDNIEYSLQGTPAEQVAGPDAPLLSAPRPGRSFPAIERLAERAPRAMSPCRSSAPRTTTSA